MALHDNTNSQSGDHTSRDAAGGNIEHHGITGDDVRRLLESQQEFGMSLVAAYETAYRDLSGQLRDLARAQRDAERDAAMERGIDFESRLKRQAALDARLALMLWWLAGLTVALLAVAAIIGWLILDRGATAGLLRAGYDAALGWRRP